VHCRGAGQGFDGVVKIGLIEDMSSIYADITGGSAGSRRDRASSAPSVRG